MCSEKKTITKIIKKIRVILGFFIPISIYSILYFCTKDNKVQDFNLTNFLELIIAYLSCFIAIFTFKRSASSSLNERLSHTRPIIIASIFDNMDLNANSSKRTEFRRYVLQYNTYLQYKEYVNECQKEMEKAEIYSFFRIRNESNSYVLQYELRATVNGKDFLKYSDNSLCPMEEIFIFIPLDYKKMKKVYSASIIITYLSYSGEKIDYKYEYIFVPIETQDTKNMKPISHSYRGKYEGKVTFDVSEKSNDYKYEKVEY